MAIAAFHAMIGQPPVSADDSRNMNMTLMNFA